MVVDVATIEFFADDGSSVMTDIYFPDLEISISQLSLKEVN